MKPKKWPGLMAFTAARQTIYYTFLIKIINPPKKNI